MPSLPHLWETVERLRGAGLSSEDAEQEALGRFGSPEQLAASFAEVPGGRTETLLTR